MRFQCETEGCEETATGTWAVNAGRKTVCCDEHNPSGKEGSAPGLPVGFWYIRWFPMPTNISEDMLLQYASPEVIAREFAREA